MDKYILACILIASFIAGWFSHKDYIDNGLDIKGLLQQSFMHGVMAQQCDLPCNVTSGESVVLKVHTLPEGGDIVKAYKVETDEYSGPAYIQEE